MKQFILFSKELDENKKIAIRKLIMEHGGKEVGEYLEINDKSFKDILKIIQSDDYNIGCEQQESTKIMTLGKKKPIPPIDPTFQEEMREFKNDMLEFKKDMLEFKNDMLEFKKDMLEFKKDMLDFKSDMLEFKTIVLAFIKEQRKFNKLIIGRLDNLVSKNNLVE